MNAVLNVFVVVKALVLILMSVSAMVWFCKGSFKKWGIIFVLAMSIGLIISEVHYRFTYRSLRYRFIQNALAQWQVFICFHMMVTFTRKNGAATFKMPLVLIFLIMHVLFLLIFLFGVMHKDFYTCEKSRYPIAFIVQYGVFYMSWILFQAISRKDYYIKWHPTLQKKELQDGNPDNNVESRHMRVKMLFDEQSKRFTCFFNWLIFLTTLTIVVVAALMIRKEEG